MGYRVAVVGATGNVGNEMLQILAERKFPVDEVVALASERSTGKEVSFGDDRTLKVQDLSTFDFRGWEIGLFSPGAKVSEHLHTGDEHTYVLEGSVRDAAGEYHAEPSST